MANLNDIYMLAESIRRQVEDLPSRLSIAANQVNITSLSEMNNNLGLVTAGEFRSGNGVLPGQGFTGLRIGYPLIPYDDKLWNLSVVNNDNLVIGLSGDVGEIRIGNGLPVGGGFSGLRMVYPSITYDSQEWNLVGVDNDHFMVGIRSSDGTLVAARGNVTLDDYGITFTNRNLSSTDRRDQLNWIDGLGTAHGYLVLDMDAGSRLNWEIYPTSTGTQYVSWRQHGRLNTDHYFSIFGETRLDIPELETTYLNLSVKHNTRTATLAIYPGYIYSTKQLLMQFQASSDLTDYVSFSSDQRGLAAMADGWYDRTSTGDPQKLLSQADVQYPQSWEGWLRDTRMSAGAVGTAIDTASVYNFLTWGGDTTNANVEYAFDICLSTGNYRWQMEIVKGPDAGIFDVYIDTGKITGDSSFDLYAASMTYNTSIFCSFNLTTPGNHVMKVVNAGKNAGSSGYKIYGSRLSIFRMFV